MKKINKLLFVAFATLVLLSCSSVKKTAKTNADLEEKTKVETMHASSETKNETTKTTAETKADKSLVQIESETNELETRITLYDTDKPIVPGTNKPPVKAEKVISNKKQSKTDTKAVDNSTAKTNITTNYTASLISKIDSLKKVNASLISKTDAKETPVNNSWYWWLIGGMLIPIALWLAWKFK